MKSIRFFCLFLFVIFFCVNCSSEEVSDEVVPDSEINTIYTSPFSEVISSIMKTDDGYIAFGSRNTELEGPSMPWIVFFDRQGVITNQKTYAPSLQCTFPEGLELLPDGGHVFWSTVSATCIGQCQEFHDLVVRLDADGNEMWRHDFDSFCVEGISDMIVDSRGNIALSGWGVTDGIDYLHIIVLDGMTGEKLVDKLYDDHVINAGYADQYGEELISVQNEYILIDKAGSISRHPGALSIMQIHQDGEMGGAWSYNTEFYPCNTIQQAYVLSDNRNAILCKDTNNTTGGRVAVMIFDNFGVISEQYHFGEEDVEGREGIDYNPMSMDCDPGGNCWVGGNRVYVDSENFVHQNPFLLKFGSEGDVRDLYVYHFFGEQKYAGRMHDVVIGHDGGVMMAAEAIFNGDTYPYDTNVWLMRSLGDGDIASEPVEVPLK